MLEIRKWKLVKDGEEEEEKLPMARVDCRRQVREAQ